MPSDLKPRGVGVIGTGLDCQFALERLSLRTDFRVVVRSADSLAVNEPSVTVVYFAGTPTADLVFSAVQAGKHVVLETASGISEADLHGIAEMAITQQTLAVIDEPRRWDDDFACAKAVFDSGVLGTMQRIRLAVHERGLPGETFPQGVLQHLGPLWLDQLLVFADSEVTSFELERFYASEQASDIGFLVTFKFDDGISAVVELQTQSLLSLRTGWLLEGSTGAYRAGRQYTKTTDGEIIDEPVTRPPVHSDPFFEALSAALNGDQASLASLPNLFHAARVARLMDRLKQGHVSGTAIAAGSSETN